MRRLVRLLLAPLALAAATLTLAPARAEDVLRVGDQRGNARALMEAAGVLDGLPYRLEWSEFPAAAPLLADYAARLARARAWALKDPAPYAAAWSRLIGLPEAVPLRWFGRAQYRAVPVDAAVVADEQRNIDLYVRAGLIPKARAPRAEAILDAGFSEALAALR